VWATYQTGMSGRTQSSNRQDGKSDRTEGLDTELQFVLKIDARNLGQSLLKLGGCSRWRRSSPLCCPNAG
jgi:hypothetical protein